MFESRENTAASTVVSCWALRVSDIMTKSGRSIKHVANQPFPLFIRKEQLVS